MRREKKRVVSLRERCDVTDPNPLLTRPVRLPTVLNVLRSNEGFGSRRVWSRHDPERVSVPVMSDER